MYRFEVAQVKVAEVDVAQIIEISRLVASQVRQNVAYAAAPTSISIG
jgi:hypothetical protein